jgi:hypothetical protein
LSLHSLIEGIDRQLHSSNQGIDWTVLNTTQRPNNMVIDFHANYAITKESNALMLAFHRHVYPRVIFHRL